MVLLGGEPLLHFSLHSLKISRKTLISYNQNQR